MLAARLLLCGVDLFDPLRALESALARLTKTNCRENAVSKMSCVIKRPI